MGVFDDILANASEEDKQVLLKYPELRKSMERLEKAAADYAQWYHANWDEEHGMTRSEWAVRQQLEELQRKLEQMQSNPTEFSQSEFQEALEEGQRSGLLTQAEVQRLLDERVRQLQQENERVLAGMQSFYSQVYTLGFRHKDEFGEVLDPNQLWNYMVQTGIRDPQLAYEQMVAPKRAELQRQRYEQAIKEAEERGMQKAKQELAMGSQGVMPTDTSGGLPIGGGEAPKGVPDDLLQKAKDLKIGDPALAQLGVEALRRGVLTQQQGG